MQAYINKGIYSLPLSFCNPIYYYSFNISNIADHVRSNQEGLKYQRFTPSSCKDIRIRKLELVAKFISVINFCERFFQVFIDRFMPRVILDFFLNIIITSHFKSFYEI